MSFLMVKVNCYICKVEFEVTEGAYRRKLDAASPNFYHRECFRKRVKPSFNTKSVWKP